MLILEIVEPTVWNGCNVGLEQKIQRGNYLQDPNTGSLYCFLHKVFSNPAHGLNTYLLISEHL